MKTIAPLIAGLALALATAAPSRAERKRQSPHETVSGTIGGKKVTVTYGRPFKKGREIFGGLVPWGKVWRLGADEATTLDTDGEITIGSLKVPKGSYTIYAIPGEKEWTLIVNKKVGTWGAFDYDQKLDVGRVAMTVGIPPSPADQLTIALAPGALTVSWDKTVASVPIH